MPHPATSAIRHLTLVPPLNVRIDTDGALSGRFRGLGDVRGHRGTMALDCDGSLLNWMAADATFDVRGTAATVHGLISESHETFTSVGSTSARSR